MASVHTDDQVTAAKRPELTQMDRCDRCPAQAFVRATLPGGGELLFCGHHASQHSEALGKQALMIDDYRHLINAKSESSA